MKIQGPDGDEERRAKSSGSLQGGPWRILIPAVVLVATLCGGSAQAAVTWVGSGPGCDTANFQLAVLAALLTPEYDRINLTQDVAGVELSISNSGASGFLDVFGGYPSCGAAAPTGTTVLSGTSTGPVFKVSATPGNESLVNLIGVELVGATQSRALVVDGTGAFVGMSGGRIAESAGGIEILNGASAWITQPTVIEGNHAGAGKGGGLSCLSGAVQFGATVENNSAAEGGGIYAEGGCAINLGARTVIAGNTADSGGGIAVSGFGTSVHRFASALYPDYGVHVEGNTADLFGGGIMATNDGAVILEDSWLRGNLAGGRGGGIYSSAGGSVTLRRSAFPCWPRDEARCSWMQGNSLFATFGNGEGSAVNAFAGGRVKLVQTYVENHFGVDDTGSALFVDGAGSQLTLEGVQYFDNRTEVLFHAVDGGALSVAYTSAAENTWQSSGVETWSSGGRADNADLDIRSSVLVQHAGFTTSGSGQITADCVALTTQSGVTTPTRNIVGTAVFFVDQAGGDLRLATNSLLIDYCDQTFTPVTTRDLDQRDRGIDDVIEDRYGRFDLGAFEGSGAIFADGFESGNTSAWSP